VTPEQKTALQLRSLNIRPVEVVTDFLSSVRKISVDSIERAYERDWVGGSKISYVLTVPAIWNDSAKNLMVKAAEKAGYGRHRVDFNLVSEPEAAAGLFLFPMIDD
jgi:molecular chaperone DnaK (HSP70)